MELEELARKYALKNAVEYDGECNPGAVIGKIMAEEDFEPQKVQEAAGKICGEVNSLTVEEQKEEIKEYEFEEQEHKHDPIPDLKDAEEKEVVVRFAPNPNGPPHIGHSRGMVINGELRDKYDGKLILRFDDTDPRNKRPLKTGENNAYEMYQEDYEWIGYEPDEVLYSSKQFEKYIKHAEELIEKEKAYVCFCDAEEGQEYRSTGEACPHRETSSEENMENWKEMREGDINEGEAVLKIKTDLDHKNPAVRDFVAFRIIEEPNHPVTGDKYRVWPLLDFAGAIEDHYMRTTHIVRGKDLRASTKRQKYIYNYLDWEYPEVKYWGNVKISGFNAPVSGSSLKKMIDKGELEGWEDVRAPTVRALRKRGFKPEAIQNFWIEMGVNEKDIEASLETLESHNREIVEKEANRYFFVADPVEIEIKGVPHDLTAEMPLHPDQPERGVREPELEQKNNTVKVFIDRNDLENQFIRLKGLCNIQLNGQNAEYVEGDHTVAVEKNAPIIQWVPSYSEDATVIMPDASEIKGLVEPCDLETNEVIQFERFGFVRCDDSEQNIFYFTHE